MEALPVTEHTTEAEIRQWLDAHAGREYVLTADEEHLWSLHVGLGMMSVHPDCYLYVGWLGNIGVSSKTFFEENHISKT